MKRVLLGTTALAAAGFFAGQAQAKFDVTVNGSWNTAGGYVSEDGSGRQNTAIDQDWEVHFRAQQTLDNGLIVGGRVELEACSNNCGQPGGDTTLSGQTHVGDQIDERWMYFRGGFGEIRVGDEDDARKLKSYTAPDPTGFIFGVNSPTFTFNNPRGGVPSSNTTIPSLENDSAKIIYFTPSFGGFQLAVSYAPDGTQDRSSFGTGGTNEPGQISNDISIGADYSGQWGSFSIGAGGGYTRGSRERNNNFTTTGGAVINGGGDPSVWAFGLNVGFGGFTVGGSIAYTDQDFEDTTSTVYDVGVTYAFEAVTVGLGWSHGDYDRLNRNPVTNPNGGGSDSLDQVQLGVGYALGPGVTLAAMVGYFDSNGSPENKGEQVAVGAGINF
jgi:hypothetical protein